MTWTVAVTVRNDRDGMTRLLDSLTRQTRTPDECVVVDAFSTDGTWDVIQAFAKEAPFPVRTEQKRSTRGEGRTRCIELATSEWVAFIDSDCRAPPEWLATYEKTVDADAGAREGSPSVRSTPLGGLGGPQRAPPDASPLQKAVDDVMEPMEAASFGGVNTGNAAYLRRALVEVGMFDTRLHTAEDPDLNAKLAKAGYRLQRIDNPVETRRRATWRALVRQHYEYGLGAVALLARHPEWFPRIERLVAPVGAAATLVLLALGIFSSPAWLALIPAGLVAAPLFTHRRLALRYLREHSFSAAWFRRLGVLWVVYVPYQLGVLVGRVRTP